MHKFKQLKINKSAHSQLKDLSKTLNIRISDLIDLLLSSHYEEYNE